MKILSLVLLTICLTITSLIINAAEPSVTILGSQHPDGRSAPAEIYVQGPLSANITTLVVGALEENKIDRGTIYLDSEGGDLSASLMFGEFIRRTGFNTAVGRKGLGYGKSLPGSCQSACVMALAAGEYRFADETSFIGIHRFYSHSTGPGDLSLGQAVSANITDYLVRMGVSPNLFHKMVNAGSAMKKLQLREAVELGLINNGQLPARWEILGRSGQIYLEGERESWIGTGKINISCTPGKPMNFTAYYGAGHNAQHISEIAKHTSVRLDGGFIGVEPNGHGIPAIDNGTISTSITINVPLVSSLLDARSLGFAWHPSAADVFYGFEIPTSEHRELIRSFLTQCVQISSGY